MVINYVVDNSGNSYNLVAAWCGFFLYTWWFYSHTFNNCTGCDRSAVPSRQKIINCFGWC